MTELPTEPVQRLIGKYEQRISKLEEVNGKLCEEINRQEKVIEQQQKDYGELAQINHRLSERIANSDVDNVLSLLDEMNEHGRIEYADYSQLHDAIAATLGEADEGCYLMRDGKKFPVELDCGFVGIMPIAITVAGFRYLLEVPDGE